MPKLAPLMADHFGRQKGVIGYLAALIIAAGSVSLLALPFYRRLGRDGYSVSQ